MLPPELIEHYRRTCYRVRLAHGGCATIRTDEPLPDALVPLLPTSDAPWAFVTAWNPRSERRSVHDNRRRQRRLLAALKALHANIRAGIGVSEDRSWREPSLFVAGFPFARLDALMRPFEQHAIVRGTGTAPAELHALP